LKEDSKMSAPKPIRRIAIVGTGVIGASWAAYYLSRGFNVVATDPGPNAEAALRRSVDDAWGALTRAGLSPGGSRDNLSFTPNLATALSDADLVQENAPERPDFKIKLFAEMDAVTPPESILASSSSGITMDIIQSACQRPERCVIGHPFNPPHVVPLVEVVGGAKTSDATIERAMAFYVSIGKKPVRLRKALPGHVANRLQAALYKEVLYLVQQGVLSVADADTAVCYGPGLRWGVMGPSLQWHVGGGAGGIRHFMEHLMDPLVAMMGTLGTPEVTTELKQRVIDAVIEEAGGREVEQLAHEENEIMLGVLALRARA
jgi:carnitine 3-dehydrogenase